MLFRNFLVCLLKSRAMKSRIQLIFGKLKKSIHLFQLRVGGDSYDQPSTVGQSDTKGAHCYRGHFLWVRFVQFLFLTAAY